MIWIQLNNIQATLFDAAPYHNVKVAMQIILIELIFSRSEPKKKNKIKANDNVYF